MIRSVEILPGVELMPSDERENAEASASGFGGTPLRVLHVEDDPRDAELAHHAIAAEWPAHEIVVCATMARLREELARRAFDIVLSDFSLGPADGFEVLRAAKAAMPETPFIFLSGKIGEERAIEAIRAGAQDYVNKSRMSWLGTAMRRALRERAEATRTREAERRLREIAGLLDRAEEAMFVTDLEGRVLYWNAGATRLYGCRADDAIGRSLAELFDAAAAAVWAEANRVTLEQGAWSGELRVNRPDGTSVLAEARRTLIRDEQGRPRAEFSISLNVGERKFLEQQILRMQRIENIGLLAAGIAHDLNNVLAPILLSIPIVRERTTDTTDLSLLELMERSAQRGAGLVRRILGFVHGAEEGADALDVRALLRDVGQMVRESFPKNIHFDCEIDPELQPVFGNATQIYQVLLNLCVNGRDAMPRGGRLRVRASNWRLELREGVELGGAKSDPYVRIDVEDEGTGIPADVLPRIWEPFFTTKPSGKGTGLGLSTVRGIVHQHGGFVTVDTTPGAGTAFHVFLPAHRRKP